MASNGCVSDLQQPEFQRLLYGTREWRSAANIHYCVCLSDHHGTSTAILTAIPLTAGNTGSGQVAQALSSSVVLLVSLVFTILAVWM